MHQVLALEPDCLQVRDGMNCGCDEVPDNTTLHQITFVSKGLLSTKWCYNNIEFEALGILHKLEKFYHYCFASKVCVITDHNPLVAILINDVAMIFQWLQCIMLVMSLCTVSVLAFCLFYWDPVILYIWTSVSLDELSMTQADTT